MTTARVLIVDDSITMRALFSSALEKDKNIQVLGAARDVIEAREMMAELRPNVLTLDVEMPGMNGIDFLAELMAERPIPVVMLSTLTQKGADVSLRAIELGAVDCFPKPQKATAEEFAKISGKLCKTVLTAARTNLDARRKSKDAVDISASYNYRWNGQVLAIAGGMGSIDPATMAVTSLPTNCPPTILSLAIDEAISTSLVGNLNRDCRAKIKIAEDGALLEPGVVHVAIDPFYHVVVDSWPNGRIRLVGRDPVNGARPSADLLLASLAKTVGSKGIGLLLSGGGEDGAAGMAALRGAEGKCLLQSPETAIIPEMIGAAIAKGIMNFVQPNAFGNALCPVDEATQNAA
ncbi:chemotaxis protein CheB [Sphingomonas sp. 35-24ZXX]|uniref:chemotaxis protein CheB n=1 Tax=Sphingomonas sp. 35-24ZXX TaxID=1545915 RepID=UPI00068EBF39|nr:chemotaxis protein CheB [Sphingomonas sp. 35-24ZXX]